MKRFGSAVLLVCVCAAGASRAADRAVHLRVPPPVAKGIAAMPQIVDPADDAERRINAAVKRLDVSVANAARDCNGHDWQRSIDVPMRGPGFLSFVVTDSWICEGTAHPDSETFSIVYDLVSGRPVDWAHLLPASLTGKQALEAQMDGTKIVTLASERLFQLYMDGYGAGQASGADLDACKQALKEAASDGPPAMMVWLDGKQHGLAVEISDLPHAVAVCETPVTIPATVLRAEGAQPALLTALDGRTRP